MTGRTSMIDKLISWSLNNQGLSAMIVLGTYFLLLWQLGLLEG